MKKSWKLSSFDTFCLGMNIKSAWLYKKVPDFVRMKSALASDALEENLRLYQCSSHYALSYVPFDPSDMNCPGNGTIIINNFLKFRANELDWGTGLPEYTFTNELPDMVKFWQPVSGGSVQVIFGGYAARLMK